MPNSCGSPNQASHTSAEPQPVGPFTPAALSTSPVVTTKTAAVSASGGDHGAGQGSATQHVSYPSAGRLFAPLHTRRLRRCSALTRPGPS